MFIQCFFFFFFSSRRRHTRSLRDWSSDVCSSDLERGRYIEYLFAFTYYKRLQDYYGKPLISSGCFSMYRTDILGRSEEHTSELQSRRDLVCRLLLEKKNKQAS